MDRREALKRTAWVLGTAISAPTIMAVLKGCAAKPTLDWKPVFFTEEQAALVSQLAETIIPKTDTPGAKDAGVPSFIDLVVKDCYKKEDQEKFVAGLKAFDEQSKSEAGDAFLDLDAAKQTEFINKVYKQATEAAKTAEPTADKPFILTVRELTLAGFFTSEPGATQVLQYEAVPGAYHGCLPLAEAGNGKTWAT
ncbi:MAG TPA: gluconate 2-dehydrogenase subunit 3 family protein [Cyclobacteriaceae bacterium]